MNTHEQIKEYMATQPEPKRSDMQELHRIILELMPDYKLWFLDVGYGNIKLISNNFSDFFNRKLNEDVIKEVLLPQLIDNLESEYRLKSNEVFGYTLLPIFGGHYDNKNMYPLDIYEHYELCGEIHLKIKDLPDGTSIQMKVIE